MLVCARLLNSHSSFSFQVKPYNVAVSVVFPPDTDTPGFENENKNKVNLYKLIFLLWFYSYFEVTAKKSFHPWMSFEGNNYLIVTLSYLLKKKKNFVVVGWTSN